MTIKNEFNNSIRSEVINHVLSLATKEQKGQLKKVKKDANAEDIMKNLIKKFVSLPQHKRVKEKLKGISIDDKFEKMLQGDTDDLRLFIWFMINEMSNQSKKSAELEVYLEVLWGSRSDDQTRKDILTYTCISDSIKVN